LEEGEEECENIRPNTLYLGGGVNSHKRTRVELERVVAAVRKLESESDMTDSDNEEPLLFGRDTLRRRAPLASAVNSNSSSPTSITQRLAKADEEGEGEEEEETPLWHVTDAAVTSPRRGSLTARAVTTDVNDVSTSMGRGNINIGWGGTRTSPGAR
jgi:hypothetical protein